MKKLENKLKKHKYDKILLKLSIDPTRNLVKVMKRINFYISLQYKVYNINFRQKYGPLLCMKKLYSKIHKKINNSVMFAIFYQRTY